MPWEKAIFSRICARAKLPCGVVESTISPVGWIPACETACFTLTETACFTLTETQ